LFLTLRDQISRGVYPRGGTLPKEETLCESFGVSRITVRRALADLVAQGLLEKRHGLGTFVRLDLPLARPIPSLSLVDSLRKTALATRAEVLEVTHAVPPPDVATLLQLKPGELAVHALRLRSKGDVPVMLTDAWVPSHLGRRVSAAALGKHALYEILMAQGVKFGRAVQELTAISADASQARLLRTELGGPLLKLVRVIHDTAAMPVQHLTAYLSPEHSRILMDIPGETVNTLSAGQIVFDGT
jgi:GntR family transcriptional regulator